MAELAKKHTDRLQELKDTVEEAQEYFQENVLRYNEFMRFVFKSSLTDNEAATLADTGKPTIEFGILEAYISRLRGEFAKQQPSLEVRAADGVPIEMLTKEFTETISVIEAHLRAIFFDGVNDLLEYNIYTDLLAGGFSALRVYTDYVNEMSFEQNICVERVFDPTLCVFDPLARESHKGDGRFCAELYPMTKDSFKERFGEDKTKNIKFTRTLSGFSWSFKNEQEEIVLVCDFYEKQQKKETIVKLSNGHSMTEKAYNKFLVWYEAHGNTEMPPVVVKKRRTCIETICRYQFCEGEVLSYEETDYKFLPIVFADGNSVYVKDGSSNAQVTRPYVYHAKGIQKLKNFAGQSLANELENTIQHKFVVALESIPVDYQDAYQNVQKADTLVYNHFLDTNNPNVVLPPPREVNRTPIPPEISGTFRMSDEMTQTILGSYDGAAGINSANMSGVSFARSAIQSNNASVPYIVGYIKAMNRVAQIIVDLIPKYYRTPRSLPILLPNGKRDYTMINKQGSLYMNYDPNSLQVKVGTGINFAMQKEIALQTVVQMSQANEGFAGFMNQYGLEVILDNIEIRGIDDLKRKAEEYQQQLKQAKEQQQQMQQQAMQMQMQEQQMKLMAAQKELQSPSQGQLGLMAIQEQAQNNSANIAIKERQAQTDFIKTLADIQSDEVDNQIKQAKVEAENTRSAVDAAISLSAHLNEKQESDSRETD